MKKWVVVITKPERARTQIAGPDPMWTTCPNCDEEILTTTEASVSIFQMLVSGCLCVFYCCCWWFPFCMDDWKDVLHTCPNCNYAIGKYKKLWWNQKTNHQKKPFNIKNFTLNKVQDIISIKLTKFEESMGLCSSFHLISRENHLNRWKNERTL